MSHPAWEAVPVRLDIMDIRNYLAQILFVALVMPSVSFSVQAQDDPEHQEPFYVNESTINVASEPDDDKALGVTPVSEGLWAREFPDGYQFYDLNGRKFTDSRWSLPGVHADPRMTPWGMIVKKAGAGFNDPYTLVRPDGSQKQLPANWTTPTAFVDELAIVGVKEGYKITYRYITPDLKIAFPNLSPTPMQFEGKNNTTPPLSEDLRAYCTNVDGWQLWGYIDAGGKVVIEPQFTDARSFHCGLAMVKDKQGKRYFINKSGRKAYEPAWDTYDLSDYDSGLFAAPGSRFNETDYYDVLGNKVKTLKRGSPFHNGYAYCFIFNEDQNKDLVHKVNTGFSDCGEVNVTTGDYNSPSYDEAGIAHFTSWMVDGGPCNGRYFFPYSIGPFSKEGYAPATMVTKDGKTTYKGFVDKEGHFKLLYFRHTK